MIADKSQAEQTVLGDFDRPGCGCEMRRADAPKSFTKAQHEIIFAPCWIWRRQSSR